MPTDSFDLIRPKSVTAPQLPGCASTPPSLIRVLGHILLPRLGVSTLTAAAFSEECLPCRVSEAEFIGRSNFRASSFSDSGLVRFSRNKMLFQNFRLSIAHYLSRHWVAGDREKGRTWRHPYVRGRRVSLSRVIQCSSYRWRQQPLATT